VPFQRSIRSAFRPDQQRCTIRALLWFAARPGDQPATAYLGEFFGAESVLLLSIGIVLISTVPWVEFDWR